MTGRQAGSQYESFVGERLGWQSHIFFHCSCTPMQTVTETFRRRVKPKGLFTGSQNVDLSYLIKN